MTSNNGTPINQTNPTKPLNIPELSDYDKFKKHLRKYKDDYIILGSGVVIGVVLTKTFRRKPTIDEAAIVQKWMENTAKTGYNIYALGNSEKELWEEAFAWAVKSAQAMNKDLSWVLKHMAQDYREFPIARGYTTSPLS